MPGKIKAAQNFPRDLLRRVLGPMFGGVECDDPNRVAVLAGHQIGDGGFEIGMLDIGLGKRGAKVPEIIDDKINSLTVIGRYDRRGPAHNQLLTQQRPENLSTKRGLVKPKWHNSSDRDTPQKLN
jgi:hypothetical protein